MVAVKGPGLGLSPQRYPELVGRRVERTIEIDEPFNESDLGIYPNRIWNTRYPCSGVLPSASVTTKS